MKFNNLDIFAIFDEVWLCRLLAGHAKRVKPITADLQNIDLDVRILQTTFLL